MNGELFQRHRLFEPKDESEARVGRVIYLGFYGGLGFVFQDVNLRLRRPRSKVNFGLATGTSRNQRLLGHGSRTARLAFDPEPVRAITSRSQYHHERWNYLRKPRR